VTLGTHAVRARNIAPNAIDSSKVRDGSLLLHDFKPGERKRLSGLAGAQGPQGPAGVQGPAGPAGPQGGDIVLGTTATLAGPVASGPRSPGGLDAAPSLPLVDPGWTQPVGAIALIGGAAKVQVPAQCDTTLGADPELSLDVSANREPDGRPNFALFAVDSCSGPGQHFIVSDVRITAMLVAP
jgi:hypothetical protein